MQQISDMERFCQKVATDPASGCHTWQAYKNANGYGRFSVNGKNQPAHRFIYEQEIGPIAIGLTIDHLCRNRACVNPAHLEAVSLQVNILRGTAPSARWARRMMCAKGHPLRGRNLVPSLKRAGSRRCRICYREYHRMIWKTKRSPRLNRED